MPSFKIIGLLVLKKKTSKDFTIYGHGGHHGTVTWTLYMNFHSPSKGGITLNLALIGQAVSEEKMFQNVEGRLMDARAWVYYKLTYEPSAQVS